MPDELSLRLIEECLRLARTAMDLGEATIASVVARGDGSIVGWGWNELKAKRDPTMHAEIAAFRDAAGRYPTDADDLILASTLEPCIMCTGAAYLCGVQTILYALRAPADGGMGRVQPPSSPGTRAPKVVGPVLEARALALFEEWLASHPRDDEQTPYIQQLVELNRGG